MCICTYVHIICMEKVERTYIFTNTNKFVVCKCKNGSIEGCVYVHIYCRHCFLLSFIWLLYRSMNF
ncbi:hypothetical protein Hdeb2414_s0011g00363461 [Helianthus debilis subsp. tardiflorus]